MANYRVVAPYVLLKVKDHGGKVVVSGFYAGAVVTDAVVDEESLRRHVDRGWVEQLAETPTEPVEDGSDSGGNSEAGSGENSGAGSNGSDDGADTPPAKPSQADPKSAWVDYAVAQGNDREGAEAMTKADLVELLK